MIGSRPALTRCPRLFACRFANAGDDLCACTGRFCWERVELCRTGIGGVEAESAQRAGSARTIAPVLEGGILGRRRDGEGEIDGPCILLALVGQ